MRKIGRKLFSVLLCVALIIGLVPGFGVSEVKAADTTVTIKASVLNATEEDIDKKDTEGWRFIYNRNNPYLLLYQGNFELVLDEDLELYYIDGFWDDTVNLTIEESGNLTINSWLGVEGNLSITGSGYLSAEEIQGDSLTISGKKIIDNYVISGTTVTIKDGSNVDGARIIGYSTVTVNNSMVTLTQNGGGTTQALDAHYSNDLLWAEEGIELSNSSIIKPSGGKVMKVSENGTLTDSYEYSYWTIRANADTPADTILIEPSSSPEDSKSETPAADNSSGESSGSKKSYKNEWVNGQWYDANGKTSYKYKGGWKVNATGWWYEDENGWFPTNMWQKIDGDWYFFHEDGYMAENEYAGKWELYSEGYWWVGSDGRWDGSEPGVWRLVGTKWWFKDSTGWYAKGKWYKIGGKWYEFDNDGWWIEPE